MLCCPAVKNVIMIVDVLYKIYRIATSLAGMSQACLHMSCMCALNLIITFWWTQIPMSFDHCNPIGSTDIPAGDTVQTPLCAGSAVAGGRGGTNSTLSIICLFTVVYRSGSTLQMYYTTQSN